MAGNGQGILAREQKLGSGASGVSSVMLAAVKGESVTSSTAQLGRNFTLPVAATVTIKAPVADGKTVNIYKYDPITRKFISIGKAVAKNGKLTFSTKEMGEMLFTTGTI